MTEMYNSRGYEVANSTDEERWPGVDSRFRLVVVAAQRSKQLLRGARPRIEADLKRRRNTSIALEEVKLGLVPFVNDTREGASPKTDELEGRPVMSDAG